MIILELTREQLLDLVKTAVRSEIDTTAKPGNVTTDSHIKGIAGLSKYLGVSHSRAQALKNSGIFPHFQTGRLILFDPVKVREAMSGYNQTKKRRAK